MMPDALLRSASEKRGGVMWQSNRLSFWRQRCRSCLS